MLARDSVLLNLETCHLIPNDPLVLVTGCFLDDMISVELATDFYREFQVELPADMSEMTVGRLHEMAATIF